MKIEKNKWLKLPSLGSFHLGRMVVTTKYAEVALKKKKKRLDFTVVQSIFIITEAVISNKHTCFVRMLFKKQFYYSTNLTGYSN